MPIWFPTRRHRVLPPRVLRVTSTAHAISPDSGTHWTEPGAWAVAPGVHRIPLPLPMDGLRAVNVYVLETDDGLTLIDGGWAIEVSRTQLEQSLKEIDREVGDIRRFLVTHVHRDHYTQAVTIRREVGSHVSLGIGDKATLDLIHDRDTGGTDPHVALLERAGAPDIARAWGEFTRRHTPDLSAVGLPRHLAGGRHRPRGRRPRPRRRAHARPHPGPLRLRRPRRVPALRRRPRAADDHAVDRLRAGHRGLAAGRLHGLADQGPRAARPHPAPGPRAGRAVLARPRRRAAGAPRAPARPLPRGGRRRCAVVVRRRGRAAVDPPRAHAAPRSTSSTPRWRPWRRGRTSSCSSRAAPSSTPSRTGSSSTGAPSARERRRPRRTPRPLTSKPYDA